MSTKEYREKQLQATIEQQAAKISELREALQYADDYYCFTNCDKITEAIASADSSNCKQTDNKNDV